MNRILILVCSFLLSSSVYGQRLQIGGIGGIGSKSMYNEFGLGVVVRFVHHIEANFGFAYGRFNGVGYTTGLTYHVLRNKVSPFVGIEYSKLHGIGTTTLNFKSYSSDIRIDASEFTIFKSGITVRVEEENMNIDGEAFWTFCVSYRSSNYTASSVKFLDSNMPEPERMDIMRRVGSGWGVFIGCTVVVDWKHDNE